MKSDTPARPFLLDLTQAEMANLLSEWGEPAYRSRQVSSWLYHRMARSFGEMTDLPFALRRRFAAETDISRLRVDRDLLSSDGFTRKWLFGLIDEARIETVLMGYRKRRTVCISTQAGCGIGCPFCATGRMGLTRNLSSGEIVEQVLHVARELAESRTESRLTNVVLMGMGEPFANYAQTLKSLRTLTAPDGFDMGARRITVSTVGLVPEIEEFSREGLPVNLSVSLHAATDELRNRLVPVNRRYPIRELMRAVVAYTERTRRRVTFEWAMIRGVNDAYDQARALVDRISGILCHVNLIPLNPAEGSPYEASSRGAVELFRSKLERARIPTTIRVRRGLDIHAGCGQLSAKRRTGGISSRIPVSGEGSGNRQGIK
jgi:23S rRNA (adenine2503-C2)-methyltransferase